MSKKSCQTIENMKKIAGLYKSIDLARLLGVDKSTVSTWSMRDHVPHEQVLKFAEAHNITPDAVYMGAICKPSDKFDASEFAMIPRYNVTGSAGGGSLVENEQVIEYLSFRKEWIRNSLRVGEKYLAVISVKGDSMTPRLKDGDVVLLDMSASKIEDNAIYALQFNGGLSIKRVQRFLSGALKIISDNSEHYAPEEITPEQAENVRVVGRVVWAGGKV